MNYTNKWTRIKKKKINLCRSTHTFTESGDKRSSSDAVDDETGDESDDFVGRPIRFFVKTDVDDACTLLLDVVVCVVGLGVVIETGGIL